VSLKAKPLSSLSLFGTLMSALNNYFWTPFDGDICS